jgi:hypothetical protein
VYILVFVFFLLFITRNAAREPRDKSAAPTTRPVQDALFFSDIQRNLRDNAKLYVN